MSAVPFEPEPSPKLAKQPFVLKVLCLRDLQRRERRRHSLYLGISLIALAVVLVVVFICVLRLNDESDYVRADAEGILSFVGFCLVYSMVGIVPFALHAYSYRPAKSRRLLLRCLSPYGDPDKLIDEIDIELRDRSFVRDGGLQPDRFYRRTTGHIIFTEHWLLWFGWSEFRFLPIAEVAWFYKRIEVQSRFWGISDRVVPYLVCVTGSGEPHLFRLFNEDYVDEALHRMLRRRPEALCGFQGEWRALAETEPAALRQLVAERRAEWEVLSAGRRADMRDEQLDDAFLNIRRVDSSSSPKERKY